MNDQEAFSLYPTDNWIYNKRVLSLLVNGYGSVGTPPQRIPNNDTYCIKPIVNLEGCSIGSEIVSGMEGWVPPPGYAWFKFYSGVHWTADYRRQPDGSWKADSLFIGIPSKVHGQFDEWVRVGKGILMDSYEQQLGGRPDYYNIPDFLNDIKYAPIVNVEYIGDNVIEAHLRGNTDPVQWDTFVPVWETKNKWEYEADEWNSIGYQYIKDVQQHPGRKGFWVRDLKDRT